MNDKKYDLEFRGGKFVGLLPMLITIIFAIYFFGIAGVYDTMALALGGATSLIIASLFAKKMSKFWDSAVNGMSDPLGNTLVLILLVVGIFAKMMQRGSIVEGFIWIGDIAHVSGPFMCAFTFVVTAIIATATGTSIGTTLSMIPILLPAGALMGASVPVMIGAILSGALFGDSIGPVSDVTIASSQTQEYKSGKLPDIGGVVRSRIKYSATAGLITIIIYLIIGRGSEGQTEEALALIDAIANPKGLLMLIPMIILLIVAFKTKSIFIAGTVGIISGTIVGLVSGLMTFSDILVVTDGTMGGFIIDGIMNMIGTALTVYMLTAIIGIMKDCGIMDTLIRVLGGSGDTASAVSTELKISFGTAITSLLIGTMNGPACLMFGPIANKIGQKAKLHPYRRANLIACFSSTLPALSPVTSVFIILAMGGVTSVVEEYDYIGAVSPMDIPLNMIYCMIFPLVLLVSTFTGWGREYEGVGDTVVKKAEDAL